jgi:N-formylmaleamate deformylase
MCRGRQPTVRETCHANGINIRYTRTGGNEPPLIALHGLTGSGACWIPLARALQDDWDVVMPDARGHGQSDSPSQGFLYPDLASDVIGLIQTLGLKHPVLMGHSMGGMTAALAASRLGSAVRAVILVEPSFISLEWQREVYESGVLAEHRGLLNLSKDELVADLRRRHPQRATELLGHLADARLATRVDAFEVLRPPYPDYRELVTQISAPILLVLGDHGVVARETARELEALNPRLRHVRIPETGHGLPYDRPDCLADALRVFLHPHSRSSD